MSTTADTAKDANPFVYTTVDDDTRRQAASIVALDPELHTLGDLAIVAVHLHADDYETPAMPARSDRDLPLSLPTTTQLPGREWQIRVTPEQKAWLETRVAAGVAPSMRQLLHHCLTRYIDTHGRLDDYELIVTLARGLETAHSDGNDDLATTLGATLRAELHVLMLALDPNGDVPAAVIRYNGHPHPPYLAQLGITLD